METSGVRCAACGVRRARCGEKLIFNQPAVIGVGRNRAPVNQPQGAVAVMLGGDALPGSICGLFAGENLGLRPVEVEKTPGAGHLFAAIHGHRVVDGGVRERVIPGRGGVVEISPRVLRNVQVAPPQIKMKLVGVTGAVAEFCGAQVGPGGWRLQVRGCRLQVGGWRLEV